MWSEAENSYTSKTARQGEEGEAFECSSHLRSRPSKLNKTKLADGRHNLSEDYEDVKPLLWC